VLDDAKRLLQQYLPKEDVTNHVAIDLLSSLRVMSAQKVLDRCRGLSLLEPES
jgi:hypothetical protein